MRFVSELTDGVTNQVGLTGSGSSSAATSFPQPLNQVKDILQANGIDVGLTFYSVALENNTSTASARLYLETSMQNESATNSLWTPIGDAAGMDLANEETGLPKQHMMSITEEIGRYLRWRIEIDGITSGPAITLTTIFKITVLGRG